MAKLLFTNKAVEDLSSIWNYTFEQWSENQADYYYKNLTNACHSLAQNPKISRKYDQIIDGLRGYHAQKHIIFFRVEPNYDIQIIRILHERMDLKSRLEEK